MQLTALRIIHEGWVAMKLLGRYSDFAITHLDCVADRICVGVQYCFWAEPQEEWVQVKNPAQLPVVALPPRK